MTDGPVSHERSCCFVACATGPVVSVSSIDVDNKWPQSVPNCYDTTSGYPVQPAEPEVERRERKTFISYYVRAGRTITDKDTVAAVYVAYCKSCAGEHRTTIDWPRNGRNIRN